MTTTSETWVTMVRHGETAWNREDRIQGHRDSGLNEMGIRQAQAVADCLDGEHWDALYSSDLGRALQTAESIAKKLDLDVIKDEGLREINLGMAQGLTMGQFQERFPDVYARYKRMDVDFAIPGGESIRQRHDRCIACIQECVARHAGHRIIVVTHGGVLDSMFRHVVGLPLSAAAHYAMLNASINHFRCENEGWRLEGWGYIRHLDRLPPLDGG